MKKAFCVLVLMMMCMLCSCDSNSVQTAAVPADNNLIHNDFSETADIHIEVQENPGEEYTEALISGNWTGRHIENIPTVIKLRGNSSKESEKQAYNIKFEEEMEFLGMQPGKKWALVSNPFDKSLLRPAIGFSYAEALGIDYTPETRLCNIWLNDRYMGVYTVMEPVEAGAGRVEIDPDEGDFLLERNTGRYESDKVYIDSPTGMRFEFNEPEEPDADQQNLCYELLQQTEEAIKTKEHEQYEKYIDVDSFINFYIYNELIKDVDFGEYSTRYYFKDGIMHAGPPWDLDLTMGNVSTEKEEYKYYSYNNTDGAGDESGSSTTALWVNGSDYYYWLCRDPWFSNLVKQRWNSVRDITENLAVENELGISLIDRYLQAHRKSLISNYEAAGWNVSEPEHMTEWQYPADDYDGNVQMLRNWLVQRSMYLDSQFGYSALDML